MRKSSPPAKPFAYAIVERYDDEDRIEADDDTPDLIYRPIVSRHHTFDAAMNAYHRNARRTTRSADGKRVRANPAYCREHAVQAIDPDGA